MLTVLGPANGHKIGGAKGLRGMMWLAKHASNLKEEVPMTQQQYLIKRKLTMLELAQTLGSVSEACRKLHVSRQHFYDVKKALEEEGIEEEKGTF